jgi:hypothetical protein
MFFICVDFVPQKVQLLLARESLASFLNSRVHEKLLVFYGRNVSVLVRC